MRIGDLIKSWRVVEKKGQREVAAEIGIGVSTLCRIENGEMMDGAALAKIIAWATGGVEWRAA